MTMVLELRRLNQLVTRLGIAVAHIQRIIPVSRVQRGWIMSTVPQVPRISWNAHKMAGESMTVVNRTIQNTFCLLVPSSLITCLAKMMK